MQCLGNATGGSRSWSIVRILGRTSVKVKTSSFTFSLREKNCPFANSVGAAWQIKSLTGEISDGEFQLKQRQIFSGKKRELAPERWGSNN
jgi:hypothetical protein